MSRELEFKSLASCIFIVSAYPCIYSLGCSLLIPEYFPYWPYVAISITITIPIHRDKGFFYSLHTKKLSYYKTQMVPNDFFLQCIYTYRMSFHNFIHSIVLMATSFSCVLSYWLPPPWTKSICWAKRKL